MVPVDDRRGALASRLRALRLQHWPGRPVKQADLAKVLGVGSPSVSSWENLKQPKYPPLERLALYADFFATERSVASEPYGIVHLTPEERARRDDLLRELTELLELATGAVASNQEPGRFSDMSRGLWYFPDGADVTIVCARLPSELTERMPYADPNNPDFSDLYTLADPGALMELFGHIRAANPNSEVKFRPASILEADEYQNHLVCLGGIDWNVVTRDVLARFDLPVAQFRRKNDDAVGGFVVTENGKRQEFMATLNETDEEKVLVEDIAHFFRAPSPYDPERSVTICNGTYSRGVYGAVRALTDAMAREENEAYVVERFGDATTFSILTRVIVANGVTITPHWNVAESRLHEWSVG
ncbi:MAG TPA: helix-turn-helix transcriptional regulator [Pseudonocardiaceae bacterium]|nr:helix-turn-helix transcriptional regulator [Pseudonocardiaceae bacterium]